MADKLDENGLLVEGPFAGHRPEDALQQVMGIASAKEQENQRLREAAAQPPPEPPKAAAPLAGPDLDVIRGEDREAATKELTEFTQSAVETLYNKRVGEERARTFPSDRQRAITTAKEMVEREGGDWSRFGPRLETAMTEANKVSRDQQIDPNAWYGLWVAAAGKESMAPPTDPPPFTERPSPATRPGQRPAADSYEMPIEAQVHARFDEMTGEGNELSPQEWAHLRDHIHTQAEWDAWQRERTAKQTAGRR